MGRLGPVSIGRGHPARIMGAINASPESFYAGSVRGSRSAIAGRARQMEKDGADIIDIGGMSTAPYLQTAVSEETERDRMVQAIRAARSASRLPISADTCRAGVAQAALNAGACIINDVTGLHHDAQMDGVLRRHKPSVILCAHSPSGAATGSPAETARLLQRSIAAARRAGIAASQIAADPAIGFFRQGRQGPFHTQICRSWAARDLGILDCLGEACAGMPPAVSISRKSFVGHILGIRDPAGRLAGSLACEALAVMRGAAVIRTHDVQHSKNVARLARTRP